MLSSEHYKASNTFKTSVCSSNKLTTSVHSSRHVSLFDCWCADCFICVASSRRIWVEWWSGSKWTKTTTQFYVKFNLNSPSTLLCCELCIDRLGWKRQRDFESSRVKSRGKSTITKLWLIFFRWVRLWSANSVSMVLLWTIENTESLQHLFVTTTSAHLLFFYWIYICLKLDGAVIFTIIWAVANLLILMVDFYIL